MENLDPFGIPFWSHLPPLAQALFTVLIVIASAFLWMKNKWKNPTLTNHTDVVVQEMQTNRDVFMRIAVASEELVRIEHDKANSESNRLYLDSLVEKIRPKI